MNRLYPYLGLTLLCLICACSNKPVKTTLNPIVGTWKLQEQNITTYVDGAEQVNSHGTTGDKSNPTITFNSDGSYLATAAFSLNGTLDPLGSSGSAGFTGKYSVADTIINLNPFFIGTLWVDTLLSPQWAVTFSNKIVIETVSLKELTSSYLTLETQIVVMQTTDQKSRMITTKTTYNYTR